MTMSTREQLHDEIETIPEPLLHEVLDFVQFIKRRASLDRLEVAIASESALRKDWLKPEEDAAWQDL
jgi:hypothetical protein